MGGTGLNRNSEGGRGEDFRRFLSGYKFTPWAVQPSTGKHSKAFHSKMFTRQSQLALSNGLEVQKETLDAEIKSFFDSASPLKNSDDISGKLEGFVKKNSTPSRAVELAMVGRHCSVPCAEDQGGCNTK